MRRNHAHLFGAALVAAAMTTLSACGGGAAVSPAQPPAGSAVPAPPGSPVPAPAPAPSPVPSPTPSPAPAPAPVPSPPPSSTPAPPPTLPPVGSPVTPTPPPAGVTAVPPLSAATAWSDPATWGGTLPPAGARIVIPPGRAVLLDVRTPALAGVEVQGALYFGDRDAELTAGFVMVTGLMQAGTEAQPHRSRATITLTGTDEAANLFGMGTKFLGAMAGGRVELHGHRRDAVAWTQLATHASPGDTTITLAAAPDWRAGDEIAIAPSGYDAREAEKVTVTAVNGTRVSFAPALRHRHWGSVQSVEGRALDMRAAVGLLTRDIVIQGDTASDASNFGGHVMIMGGGFARIAGVEFRRMGQAGHQARYPLHWHLVDRQPANGITGAGQYAIGNSFNGSFQRAIVMHGTSNLRAERNVSYNIPNHAFVPAEDGDEENNVWRHNLAILTRHALTDEQAFPPSQSEGFSVQTEDKPSAFWMRNMNNTFVGNVAAGSVGGNGFFFDGFIQFTAGDPATQMFRVQRPARRVVFEDNVAHSLCGLDLPDGRFTEAQYAAAPRGGWTYSIYEGVTNHHGLFVLGGAQFTVPAGQTADLQFVRFTAYKSCGSGAWLEMGYEVLRDSIISDSHMAVDAENGPTVRNSVLVGPTANDIGGRAPKYYGLLFNDDVADSLRVENVVFVGINGGAIHLTDDINIGAGQIRSVRLVNSVPLGGSNDLRGGVANALMDMDGSLTGTGRPTRISLSPISPASVIINAPLAQGGTIPIYLTPQ